MGLLKMEFSKDTSEMPGPVMVANGANRVEDHPADSVC
jgi:hypothetical protein